jgi:hypothetical protein
MLSYPAALPLSSRTVVFTAGVIRRHRVRIGSPWRKLNPTEQALLVLAYLRKGETFAGLAAGFGIGTATAWRYVTETVALLAARSPKLRTALAARREVIADDQGLWHLCFPGRATQRSYASCQRSAPSTPMPWPSRPGRPHTG